MAQDPDKNYKIIAENRRARFDYFIESDLEVGIVLTGSEVKSLRTGQSNIAESYANIEQGELWLINGYISALTNAGVFGHDERRRRKLLLHRAELTKISRQIQDPGLTIVPLSLYFLNGRVKVEIGVARGNREYDKRHKLREQQDNREAQRAMRMRNRRAGVA